MPLPVDSVYGVVHHEVIDCVGVKFRMILDKETGVSLFAEVIDDTVVAFLIGNVGCGETGLLERRYYPFHRIDAVKLIGGQRRQEERHALVGSVAFRHCSVEHHYTVVTFPQLRIGGAFVAGELPGTGARGLPPTTST